jgi:protein-S-isoprenylcysteine O-methyltransferase Ste14
MHPVTLILEIVAFIWIASEIVLAIVTRARQRRAVGQDAGSLAFLWGAIAAGIWAAIALRSVGATTIRLPVSWLHAIALVIMAAGLAIRWTSIITLGRFFTSSVTVAENHELVRTGLYRHIRHPSYTGLLVTFFGVALSYGNWLSLAAIVLAVSAALTYRIRVEEAALLGAFGEDYVAYSKSTRRLIPGIY